MTSASRFEIKPVAIIGLGNMGLGMARALLAAGFTVNGCDIAPSAQAAAQAAGVKLHPAPSDAVSESNTVLIAVVNAAQIDVVLVDLLPVLTAQHTVLFMSTIAPSDAARFAAAVLASGAQAIDAPMSGGPARAAAGQMTLMLAGKEATLARAKPVTDVLANRSFVLSSKHGDAMKAKLLNNLLAGIHLAAGAQVLRVAGELGLDEAAFLELSQVSSGQSWIAGDRLPRALANDFEPRSYLHILSKDVGLANDFLIENKFILPLGTAAQGVFQAGLDAGHCDLDDAALYLLATPKAA